MVFLRCACVAILLATTGVQARAQDAPSPEALAAAEELLSVTSPDVSKQLLTQMNRLIWPVIEQQIARRNSVDDATVADLRAEIERLQLKQLNELLKAAPPIYARHFSVDELHQLVAFYRSPVGTKALRELPLVLGEFVTTIAPKLQDMHTLATEAADRVLRAHGYIK